MPYNNGGNGKTKYVHKDNRGSMWENDHKTTEKHPDFRGSLNVDGTVYWISGWTDMKNGKRYMSLSVQPQEERTDDARPTQQAKRPAGKW